MEISKAAWNLGYSADFYGNDNANLRNVQSFHRDVYGTAVTLRRKRQRMSINVTLKRGDLDTDVIYVLTPVGTNRAVHQQMLVHLQLKLRSLATSTTKMRNGMRKVRFSDVDTVWKYTL